mmetsp:Transcript_31151/g.52306  ORF Transcript_31151/g.52306 Transcript_31151/m.52306 type:complete len:360 (+) Transcript_31151:291-1370(+)
MTTSRLASDMPTRESYAKTGASKSSKLFSGLASKIGYQSSSASRRFDVSPDEYLKQNRISVYIQDVVQRIGEASANPTATNPIEATTSYFQRVTCGTHVEGRGFEYVSATPYNRRCFVLLVESTFAARLLDGHVSPTSRLNCSDCHAILQLLCLDIPLRIAEEATLGAQAQAALKAAHMFKETVKPYEQGESRTEERAAAKDSDKWRFSDFLDGLRITFVYNEFISLSKTQVFGTVSPYNLSTPLKYMSEFRSIIEKLISEGCEVPPEAVVQEALDVSFREAAKPSGLSRIDFFIGWLCSDETLRTQHRSIKLVLGARAAAVAARTGLKEVKRVEIAAEPSAAKPRIRAKSASRSRTGR